MVIALSAINGQVMGEGTPSRVRWNTTVGKCQE